MIDICLCGTLAVLLLWSSPLTDITRSAKSPYISLISWAVEILLEISNDLFLEIHVQANGLWFWMFKVQPAK